MEALRCPGCGPVPRPLLEWRAYVTWGGERHRHLGAYCPRCGRWLKWLRQRKPMLPQGRRP